MQSVNEVTEKENGEITQYTFSNADEAANNVILTWKRYNVEVLYGRGLESEFYDYIYLLHWRQTNFFCIILIFSW